MVFLESTSFLHKWIYPTQSPIGKACPDLSAIWKVMVIIGGFLGLFGFVFALQGYGIVGPGSSPMYNSSTWVYYGAGIAIVGLLVFLGGLFLASSEAKSKKTTL